MMAQLEAQLEQSLQANRDEEAKISLEIQGHDQQIQALCELEKTMMASEYFDAEDRRAVQAAMEVHGKSKESLARKRAADGERLRRQERTVSYLTTILLGRRDVLDTEDGKSQVLQSHPELLEFFAKKQLELNKLLD